MTEKQIIKGKILSSIPSIAFYCKNRTSKYLTFNANFSRLISYENYVDIFINGNILKLKFSKKENTNSYKINKSSLNYFISANNILNQIDIPLCEKRFKVEYLNDNIYTADLSKALE